MAVGEITRENNPLGKEPVGRLIFRFAVPAVIGLLVSALYNIVDQIFIGQGIGLLGNAATNVAFPLTSICNSIALMMGIGGAANFNLSLGRGDNPRARKVFGTALTMMIVLGIILTLVVRSLMEPMIWFFGSTEEVYSYAFSYISIISFGFPFLILSTGFSMLIRADGSPLYSMACMILGAVINTILDPLFIFVFGWGMEGAALATIIGQIGSGTMCLLYLRRVRTVKPTLKNFIPSAGIIKAIVILGLASWFNQIAMSALQIVMNNTITYYGALSEYGSDIPLAVVGIISKVNTICMAFVIGVSQGAQPTISFNYGAKQYSRVRKAYFTAVGAATFFSILIFLAFQIFPRQIISIFGEGSELYYQFAENYFRIFLFMIFAGAFNPHTSGFLTSIGKAKLGMIISITKQLVFSIPLVLILPIFMGIDGIMYAGPIGDCASVIVAVSLMLYQMKKMRALERETLAGH